MNKSLRESFERERDSPCKHDSKKHHFWEKIGVVYTAMLFEIWRCSQCAKVIWEPLESLVLNEKGEPVE